MLVLELYTADQKVAPARHGFFEGTRIAVEVAVKDRETFVDGWAYFGFGDGSRKTAGAFPKSACFNCHAQHAATDNVFTQFYPVLRRPADRAAVILGHLRASAEQRTNARTAPASP